MLKIGIWGNLGEFGGIRGNLVEFGGIREEYGATFKIGKTLLPTLKFHFQILKSQGPLKYRPHCD